MSKRMPPDALLDSNPLGNRSNILAQNCLSPVWPPSPVTLARKNPVVRLRVSTLFPPLRKSFGEKRMKRDGLLRGFGLARTDDTINDGAGHTHASLSKIDVTPAQSKEFALAQAGGRRNENQGSFPQCKSFCQGLDFNGWLPTGANMSYPQSEQSKSSLGFVVCPWRKAVVQKVRNVMSVLFNHACRYEFFDRNPICLVRQSAKRRTAPSVLTPIASDKPRMFSWWNSCARYCPSRVHVVQNDCKVERTSSNGTQFAGRPS